MADELLSKLEAALGTRYRIVRELGGGGMSRVFLAEESALGREVVIKVFAPEIASGISADRFRREIQTAARLQHPHIVPLFSAGEEGDLLYFTMPFVEGESLRGRLRSTGELPVGDSVRILRDVASALAYAHQHGVVHRDVKPENVLLSGAHAVVTDFGVAKALSEASRTGTLTSAGLALGTPAYMSPEQASADPATDHRADLYALGVIGYELLSGSPPFTGRAPAQLLAAHATETPEPVTKRRASIPPALASLVMRLLEKRPADRPQTAEEVLRELESLGTPSGISATGISPQHSKAGGAFSIGSAIKNKAGVSVAVIALIGLIAAGIWYSKRARPVAMNANALVIAPFRVAGADPSLHYLREGMVDLLAAKFTGEGGPSAADPRTVMSAWARTAKSAENDLPEVEAVRIAEQLGAGRLVLGGIVGNARHLVLTASLLRVPGGDVAARATAEGPPDSLAAIVDRLAVLLLAGEVKGGEQLTQLMTIPIDALRSYLAGRAAYRRGDYETAVSQLNEALESDSTFAHAALALAVAANWGGTDAERAHGVRLSWKYKDKLSQKDRAYLELFAGPSYPTPSSPGEFIEAGRRAAAIAPDNPEVWYEYGDAIYHSGPTIGFANTFSRAAQAFKRAITLDPDFVAPREHLIDIYAREGDVAQVRNLSQGYLTRNDNFGTSEYTRWRVAQTLSDSDALKRIRPTFSQMSLNSLGRLVGFGFLDGIASPDLELARLELRRRSEVGSDGGWRVFQLALAAGRPAEALRIFDDLHPYSDRIDRAFTVVGAGADLQGDSAAAAAAVIELDRLKESKAPLEARLAAACALANWSARLRDVPRMRQLLQFVANERSKVHAADSYRLEDCLTVFKGIADFIEHGPAAGMDMQRLDSVMRVTPVRGHEAFDGDITQANVYVARWYELRGMHQEALAAIRRRLYHWGTGVPPLPLFLREEGRLAALAGDKAGAIRAYRHYLIIRQNPEPAIKPQVDSVRAELARLQ